MVFSVPAIASNVDIDIAPNAKHDQFRDIIETNIDESNNDEDVFDKEKRNAHQPVISIAQSAKHKSKSKIPS